jgi:hypothetical protein
MREKLMRHLQHNGGHHGDQEGDEHKGEHKSEHKGDPLQRCLTGNYRSVSNRCQEALHREGWMDEHKGSPLAGLVLLLILLCCCCCCYRKRKECRESWRSFKDWRAMRRQPSAPVTGVVPEGDVEMAEATPVVAGAPVRYAVLST